MRILDLENRTGLERATIRFYEKEGLITPKRTENGYREYSEEDFHQLMKIKLLRQLGLSLEKIKDLQQGKADFAAALDDQIQRLSQQIEDQQRAREVCREIRSAGVDYENMDAEYYLKLLKEMPLQTVSIERRTFEDAAQPEIHPVRRFFARMIDGYLLTAIVQFILYVVLRIRPLPTGFLSLLLTCGIWCLLVPIEALFLHRLGTTPGKWIMGIRVEYFEGGNLPLSVALSREWQVYTRGMGCGIPFVAEIFMVYRWCQLTGRTVHRFSRYDEVEGPEEMAWDDHTELIYCKWERKGKWLLAGVVCIYVLLTILTASDSYKPKYRGADLTLSQFAANYNNLLSIIDNGGANTRMQSDGTWYPQDLAIAEYGVVVTPGDPDVSFTYETEDGYVRSIRYENSWDDVFFIQNPIDGKCMFAVMSTMLAQDWCSSAKLKDFSDIWESQTNQPEGKLTYENLEIIWQSDLENCTYAETYYIGDEDAPYSKLSFSFELIIHED